MKISNALNELSKRRDELAYQLGSKGIEVESKETLYSMIPKIELLELPDPSYRTNGWFVMPEVSDDEIYMLMHLTPPAENYLAFSCTCTGTYLVEYGIISGGNFVRSGYSNVTSGVKYSRVFHYEDWGHEVDGGARQVMIRITGTAITKFEKSNHANRLNAYLPNLVDFKAKMTSCTSCAMGAANSTSVPHQLKYFELVGTNKITSATYMFANCRSLISAKIDTSYMTNISYFFYGCSGLATAEINITKITTATSVFSSNYCLTKLLFTGSRTTWPADIALNSAGITVDAAVDFFESLPTITTSRNINLSSTPSKSIGLTEEQTAIATNKNWTLT